MNNYIYTILMPRFATLQYYKLLEGVVKLQSPAGTVPESTQFFLLFTLFLILIDCFSTFIDL